MSKKLFVGGLPFSVTKEQLRDMFAQYGSIVDAIVIMDRMTRRSKGFGFVTFDQDGDATNAVAEMNGKSIEGRTIVVNEARPMEERPSRGGFNQRY
ncbi:MAG: RNA-binding protein [Candidatus Diapherotrites archaeon]|nr:RNA-binding protein [Candidatus Diapherotrites archaeon]